MAGASGTTRPYPHRTVVPESGPVHEAAPGGLPTRWRWSTGTTPAEAGSSSSSVCSWP
jgi:hypothetical protein